MLTNISSKNPVSRIYIGDHDFVIPDKKTAKIQVPGFRDSESGSHQKVSLGVALPQLPDVTSINTQKVYNELADFDISGFSRLQIAVLIALIEASKEDLISEGAQQGMYTKIAQGMVDFTKKDIEAQGNAALIGSVVSSAAGAISSAVTSYQNIKASNLNIRSADLNRQAADASLSANAENARRLAAEAQKAASQGNAAASKALISKLMGDSVSGLSSGIVKKVETSYVSIQKTEEQNTHVANTFAEAANQEKQRVKDLLNQIIRLLQEILADQKQATDTAATMRC